MSLSGRRSRSFRSGRFGSYHTGSIPTTPTLAQSVTPSSTPSIARVLHRISDKMKKSKKKATSKRKFQSKNSKIDIPTKSKPNTKTKRKKDKNNKTRSTIMNAIKTSKNRNDRKSNRFLANQPRNRSINQSVNQSMSSCTSLDPKSQTVCGWFESAESMMKSKGFKPLQKVADTLQGAIYRCRVMDHYKVTGNNGQIVFSPNSRNTVIIKVTSKRLHSEGITLTVDGQRGEVEEDILKERDLLQRLSGHNGHFLQFIDFWETQSTYCLVEEDGGDRDLFWWTVQCHGLIQNGKMKRKEWRLISKVEYKLNLWKINEKVM